MTQENKKRLDTWITDHYGWLRNEVNTNICKGGMNQYTDDMMSHMVESLYALSDEKITQMLDDQKLKWWFLRGCGFQLRSSSSPFWHTYRKHKMGARENGLAGSNSNIFDGVFEEYDPSLELCLEEAWDKMDWYLRTLMDKYFYQKYSVAKLHEYYGISKNHLIKDINKGIHYIREYCKHC